MTCISHLFLKPETSLPMQAKEELSVRRGFGIANDINASLISPRQVLVTRKEDLDELAIPYGGLRENIIIRGVPVNMFCPGSLLVINEAVHIRLTFYCEPCKIIAAVVPGLKAVIHRRGILGVIVAGGTIRVNDLATCVPGWYEPFPEIPYGRFLYFMQLVPKGKLVTYKMICLGMGVADSYVRAIPRYVERASREGLEMPLHRIVDEGGHAISRYVTNQVQLLKEEGIEVAANNLARSQDADMSVVKKFLWGNESIYLDNELYRANSSTNVIAFAAILWNLYRPRIFNKSRPFPLIIRAKS